MNKAILMGRLTKAPETRTTPNGTVYTTFTLAVNRRFATQEPKADFINIITWSKTAEFCSMYFKKGQQVGVIGRIQTRNYEDETGTKRYITEVVGEEVYFADSKQGGDNSSYTPKEETNSVDFSSFDGSEFNIETDDDVQMG